MSQAIIDRDAQIAQHGEQMEVLVKSVRTLDNELVEKIEPGKASNPNNVKNVERIISAETWDFLFPLRNPAYTYENFLKAVGKYPAFCDDYTDGHNTEQICRDSLAVVFAHFTQETSYNDASNAIPRWRQGLYHLREMGYTEETRNAYLQCDGWTGEAYPCGTFADGTNKSYFGRGAKQLSYNYNYGPFSQSIYGDVETLLNNPERVADTWMNLASAIWFFITPQPPKPSMLHVIDGTWQPNQADLDAGITRSFGHTTNIINGGLECGKDDETPQSVNRMQYFKEHANYLSVDVASLEPLGCQPTPSYNDHTTGSGAVPINWEQSWTTANQCNLVTYQTGLSALAENDYVKCIEKHFNVKVIDDLGELPLKANAGNDQSVNATNGVTVSLSGEQSSGEITGYKWQQVSGPISVEIQTPDQAATNIQLPALTNPANFIFSLTISDDGNATDTDTVTVTTVVDGEPVPPEITMTAPQQVESGKTGVRVQAVVKDENPSELKYDWKITDDIPFQISSNGSIIEFNAPEVEINKVINVELEVTNQHNLSMKSVSTITVLAKESECSGNWDSSQVYHGGDQATYNNGIWKAKWWTQGDIPGAEQSWATPWEKIGNDDCDTEQPPIELPSLAVTGVENSYELENGSVSIPMNVNTSAEVAVKATLTQGSNIFAEKSEMVNGSNLIELFASDLSVGTYQITVTGSFNDGSKEHALTPQAFIIALTDNDNSTPPPSDYPIYEPGKSYSEGDIVTGVDGNSYQCKPWPYTAWCSNNAYAPGDSLYWADAWDKI
ncbi:glycoside hydrolase family 19 protein [uncultured Vibrio sp.]|uniref:glycoside hydrolase family 19 protein n=1 Tax=uncultured Vibrio sp. TaxID=114054 RepID=UPI0026318C37|nr:glycoside hydrolase family 19 protein [uncultured Vibrio sp.]